MLLLLLLPILAASQKLSFEENYLLRSQCGLIGEPYERYMDPIIRENEKGNRRHRSMVGHGKPSNFYDAPWSAFFEDMGCTGTWISPRHVLTSAHCIFELIMINGKTCMTEQALPMRTVNIVLDCSEEDPLFQKCKELEGYQTSYNIVKATVLKKAFSCTDDDLNDIALIEIEDRGDLHLQQFACLPKKELKLRTDVQLYGYGYAGETSNRELNMVDLTIQANDIERDLVVSYATNNASCRGDSGAGYVHKQSDRIVIAAVHHGGHDKNGSIMKCGTLNVEKTHLATAVYPHLDWICFYSGVCPTIGMYEEVMTRAKEIEQKVKISRF